MKKVSIDVFAGDTLLVMYLINNPVVIRLLSTTIRVADFGCADCKSAG